MFEVTTPPPAPGYWMVASDGGIFAFGDARLVNAYFLPIGSTSSAVCGPPLRYGPWTPPERVRSGGTLRFTHTYTEAGTYRAIAGLSTGDACSSPYRGLTEVETTVVVTAPSRG